MRHEFRRMPCDFTISLTLHHFKWKPTPSGPQLALAVLWSAGQSPRPSYLLRVFHERLLLSMEGRLSRFPCLSMVFVQSLHPWITLGGIVGDAWLLNVTIQVGSKIFCTKLMGIEEYIMMWLY